MVDGVRLLAFWFGRVVGGDGSYDIWGHAGVGTFGVLQD